MSAESSHACGGDCCRRFCVSMTPERLAERHFDASARIDADEASASDWDDVTVAEMLIELEPFADGTPAYTCTHFDGTSGLCTIYERRPAVCRDYPGYGRGGVCEHCSFSPEPKIAEQVQLQRARAVAALTSIRALASA